MPQTLTLPLALAALLGGVFLMWRGSGYAGDVLDRLRRRMGYPEAAGAAFLGLATATPEISINVSSVLFGWPDLGLGAALGSNTPAIPFAILLSFLAVRFAAPRPEAERGLAQTEAPLVRPAAVPMQFVPYLLVVLLLAALTLPPAWAGLQPVDAAILLIAWAAWVIRALSKHRRGERVPEEPGGRMRLLVAGPLIAAGAVASVWGGSELGKAAGLPDMVTGLFLIGGLCALPESISAWRFARQGHATFGVSAAGADGVVSLTLALVPPALITSAVGDRSLYVLNLAFLALTLAAYIGMNNPRFGERLGALRVSVFVVGYGIYLALTVWLLTGAAGK
jgi:cation:H+ antiporter